MSFGGVSNPRQKGWPKSFSITRIVAPPHNHSCGHCLKKHPTPKKENRLRRFSADFLVVVAVVVVVVAVVVLVLVVVVVVAVVVVVLGIIFWTHPADKKPMSPHSRHSPKHPIHRHRFDKWTVAPRKLLVVITWGPLRYVPRPEGIWRCWMMLVLKQKSSSFFCNIFFLGGGIGWWLCW